MNKQPDGLDDSACCDLALAGSAIERQELILADAYIEKLPDAAKQSALFRIIKSRYHYALQEFSPALKQIDPLIDFQDIDFNTLIYAARLSIRENTPERANTALDIASKLSSGMQSLEGAGRMLVCGELFCKTGSRRRARTHLTKAISLNPQGLMLRVSAIKSLIVNGNILCALKYCIPVPYMFAIKIKNRVLK